MTATQEDARLILEAGSRLLADAVAAAKDKTAGGKKIDDHQIITERVAYAATKAVLRAGLLQPSDEDERRFAEVELPLWTGKEIRARIQAVLGG